MLGLKLNHVSKRGHSCVLRELMHSFGDSILYIFNNIAIIE